MTRSLPFLARAVLVAGVTGAGLMPVLPAAASGPARQATRPAECMPCGDPAECAPSGLRTPAAPRCVPPPDTQPDDANLVADARAGWEALVSPHTPPDPGVDYVPIPDCPMIDIADLTATLDAHGLLAANLPEFTASIGKDLPEEGERAWNLNVFCNSQTDDDGSGRVITETGILATVLPDGTSVDDVIVDADEVVVAEPSEALLGGAMTGYCAESRPGAYCFQIWNRGPFVIMVFAGAPGGDPSMLPAVGDTLTDLLPAVLTGLGSYAVD